MPHMSSMTSTGTAMLPEPRQLSAALSVGIVIKHAPHEYNDSFACIHAAVFPAGLRFCQLCLTMVHPSAVRPWHQRQTHAYGAPLIARSPGIAHCCCPHRLCLRDQPRLITGGLLQRILHSDHHEPCAHQRLVQDRGLLLFFSPSHFRQ